MRAILVAAVVALAGQAIAQQVMDDSDDVISNSDLTVLAAKLVDKTPDPYAAQFIKLRRIAGGACGLVNLKNQYGGYTGFQPFMVLNDTLFLQDTSQCRQ
jgi:hypothetical protein